MKPILALAEAVIADAVRKKVVWAVLVFAALLALAVPSLPAYGGEVVSAVYREVVVALMLLMALVVGLTLAVTRIPGECERRTVFPVLARNVRRWQYVMATWAGMFVVVGIVLLAYTAIAIVVGAVVYDQTMWVLLQGMFAVWLEAGVVMGFAVLLSTRFSPVTSVVGALVFTFAGHSVAGLIRGSSLWWLPSLELFNVVNPVAHGSGIGPAYAGSMLLAFFGWAVVLLGGASLLFEGRDL